MALPYLSRSDLPLKLDWAASMTYLLDLRMFSCQDASQVTLSSCWTRPQAWPGWGQRGTRARVPMFTVT